MFTLHQLQLEHKPWADKNFGPRPTWQPLLGMVEELGELDEAINDIRHSYGTENQDLQSKIEDGLGDVIIFMADFANGMEFDLDKIVENNSLNIFYDDSTALILIGRLSHSFLKSSQKIRGTKEEHLITMQLTLSNLIDYLRFVSHHRVKKELIDVVEQVWLKVQKRNWNKDPINGGEISNV